VPSQTVNVSVQFTSKGKPLAGEAYVIEGAKLDPGSLAGTGYLHVPVPARVAAFKIRFPARNEIHTVNVGHLDPPDEPSGIRMRLGMLGFYGRGPGSCADHDDDLEFGLRRFQRAQGLETTGQLDPATIAKVKEIFGR
jgi:hypothetical protein